MDILLKILQFLLSFSLLVLVHEFGHFIFARIFGVRVETFKIFFGKSIFSFKRGDTTWAIGWIPFGGYCKLSGMIDESMDTEFISKEPQPYEFRSKSAWKRLLIMAGGVIMNVVLAFFIYAGISMAWGEEYFSTKDMAWGYTFSEEAEALGFRDGDRILTVNGKTIEDFDRLAMALMLEQKNRVEIERDGKVINIYTPETSVLKMMESEEPFMAPRYPFVIREVLPDMGAAEAGIESGDRLLSVGGEPLVLFDEYLAAFGQLKGEQVEVIAQRDSAGVAVERRFLVNVSDDGKIGAVGDMLVSIPIHRQTYRFFQAFPAGAKRLGHELKSYWNQLKLIVSPKTEAYKSVSGPLGIGNIFPKTWDWYKFWNITALLSIALAVMNLLPIPGLDGGHILFLLVEMITRRKPGDKFIMYAQVVGMTFLLFIMVYATWNDISRIFFGG